ncbi:MAG: TAXI family TRAP transporter solute-binding subunit [Rhizobiaceae bacterium]
MKLLKRFAFAFLVLAATTVLPHAAEFEKNIMTGGATGTYIKIGQDIAKIGEQCGLTLNVLQSAGSLENFVGVRNKRNTQFGIVQSDVLEYLKTYEANDAEVQQAVRGVRIMFPLYNEEVHLLAKKEIASARDLDDKKVAVGIQDSGTFLTASLVLDLLRVNNAERQPIGPDEALEKLQAGEIDAFFYVSGAPTSLFTKAQIDPEKFHLVPLKESPLTATYTPAKLAPATYPWQKEEVELVAVKAVLMTYDYNVARNRYHRESCKAVSDFSNLILTRLDELKANGHPKWKSVNLAEVPPNWQVGICVKQGMALDYQVECTSAAPQPQAADQEYLDLLKKRLKDN